MRKFKLDDATLEELLNQYNLDIPEFQRRFVWNKNKKRLLIDSLEDGFPIGAITLYNYKESYMIIDGVQRINTLQQFFSRPSEIIPFSEFYELIYEELTIFMVNHGITEESKIKKVIKSWYTKLHFLFEYKKISVLQNAFRVAGIMNDYFDYQDVGILEELHEILTLHISFEKQEVPLILYNGKINDLPTLFKNINTGTMPLTSYEMFQAIWINLNLDMKNLQDLLPFYKYQIEVIKSEFEITSAIEFRKFDIFKYFIALNIKICTINHLDHIFKDLKETQEKPEFFGIKPLYDKQELSFELFSVICYGTTNGIDYVVEKMYSKFSDEKITEFVKKMADILFEELQRAVFIFSDRKLNDVFLTRYHSFYLVSGVIKSRYIIDFDKLEIIERFNGSMKILDFTFDLTKHNQESWFRDKNRQLAFFRDKIKELDIISDESRIDIM